MGSYFCGASKDHHEAGEVGRLIDDDDLAFLDWSGYITHMEREFYETT
jgi:hypothetical protein